MLRYDSFNGEPTPRCMPGSPQLSADLYRRHLDSVSADGVKLKVIPWPFFDDRQVRSEQPAHL